ncbi:unnamed protein product [Protopolystoma xenopodis]|uniref:Uncharacterized protein n=1 Tax=Protopolystoma xenopodis TaxID=117903 RepID=A0A3S5BB94_9PLAT|nr:unnamed protein product [Protopolystoma xenopodis]
MTQNLIRWWPAPRGDPLSRPFSGPQIPSLRHRPRTRIRSSPHSSGDEGNEAYKPGELNEKVAIGQAGRPHPPHIDPSAGKPLADAEAGQPKERPVHLFRHGSIRLTGLASTSETHMFPCAMPGMASVCPDLPVRGHLCVCVCVFVCTCEHIRVMTFQGAQPTIGCV